MTQKYLFCILLVISGFNYNSLAQTQADMNETASNDFQKADVELNRVYNLLVKTLDEHEKKLLIVAQKDWLKFRDSHCEFEAEEYEGGSIQPLIYSMCLEECTKKRIKDLKDSLESRKK